MFFRKSPRDSEDGISLKSRDGFARAYDLHAERMFIICHNRIGDREAAKEIVQEIFKSLWERRDKIIIAGPLQHYLVRAAKLEVIDYFRARARREKHLSANRIEPVASGQGAGDALDFNDLQEEVNRLVKLLPAQCHEVYGLSREQGLSNKEIALSLAISEKTVESHITKALRFLRDNLGEYQRA